MDAIATEVKTVETEIQAEATKIEQVAIADFKTLVSRVEALEARAKSEVEGFEARVKAFFKKL
jgi:hypothetical protein